jgi:hydroxymethylpyrimidine pyrophosphatase-like HAD family hydrolase
LKVLYTDLDGTMVGPYGNFFAADDRTPTLAPATALLELHRAGVALVLVSGRTRLQLQEAALIFGADWSAGTTAGRFRCCRGRCRRRTATGCRST